MISGVGRWPVRSEGGFARSRTCCVAVFCRRSRGETRRRCGVGVLASAKAHRGGEKIRGTDRRVARVRVGREGDAHPERTNARRRPGARVARARRVAPAHGGRGRRSIAECALEESAEEERKAGDGRTLTSAFGTSPSVYARYLMCDGFALKGGGAICTPRPPPLPPPMARASRERACPFGPRSEAIRTEAHPTGPRACSRADELRPRPRSPLVRASHAVAVSTTPRRSGAARCAGGRDASRPHRSAAV